IECGYRLIDTGAIYDNEVEVGRAIVQAKISRDEIIVTTKGAHDPEEHGYAQILRSFDQSLRRLALSYIDYYLVHWPSNSKLRKDTWRGMEHILAQGGAKAIGVSNYAVHHLEELQDMSVQPAMNQIEFHPFIWNDSYKLVQYNRQNNIQTVGYATLAQGQAQSDPVVRAISARIGKSSQQILTRWAINHGVVPLVRSSSTQHIIENLHAKDILLTDEDMAGLNMLHGRRLFPNPAQLP
ncbi:MAG: aldo/keto reductase, partial [Candidatus Saccharimonadales bacterium]